MSNKCVCCGAFLDAGVARCKYCGASVPVAQRNDVQEESFNQNATPQTQTPNQEFDPLGALFMSGAMVAEAARSAAESARIAAEAARAAAAAAAAAGSQSSTLGFSPVNSSLSSNGKDCGRNIFASSNWKEIWKAKGLENRYLGIILTNTKDLKNPDAFMASLNSYLNYKSQNDVDYYVLDLNNQAIEDIDAKDLEDILLNILFPLYLVTVPHYLLIVGDSTVVPCATWDNLGDSYDDNVPSDLAYITLDTTSPWDGVVYDFENITQVGRIPAKATNGFSEAIAYFEHAKNFVGYSGTATFAYSAQVWEQTSQVEFSHLKPTLITSPKYTCNSGEAGSNGLWLLDKLNPDYNMLCFNLHGSDECHVWSGQLGGFYPDAFDKKLLPQNNGYVLLTEACYGARPTYSDSIVVDALKNGCMAFVGSTRIAYGCGDGRLCCADVIAQYFTYHVATGETVGNSFLKALSALSSREMNEIDIKTLAEFSLYGDPSVCLITANAHSMQKGKKRGAITAKYSKPKKDKSRAIMLASCDGAMAKGGKGSRIVPFSHYSTKEQSQMKMMANYVSKVGSEYMTKNFATISNVKPSVYKVVGKEEYRAVYSKKVGGIKVVVQMHMDSKGNMKQVYHSK